MNMIAINKHSSKLEIWSVEMPTVQYSNRYIKYKANDTLF